MLTKYLRLKFFLGSNLNFAIMVFTLYELAWHSSGSITCQTSECHSNGQTNSNLTTYECCFLTSKYHENCNAISSFPVIRHVPFISLLWSFDAIWRYIKNQILKNEDDLNLFLNGPNFMRNGIIIPMLLVMAFLKVIHQKVSFSVNKGWT